MSIKVMNLVWSYAPPEVTQGKLLVLLAMADYSDDDGRNIFPSLATLGRKSRYSEDQVRRVIKDLIRLKLVELVKLGGWDGERNRSNEYAIQLETLYTLARQAMQPPPLQNATPPSRPRHHRPRKMPPLSPRPCNPIRHLIH